MASIALALLAASAFAREPSADDLIDRITKRPGDYSQLCDASDPIGPNVQLPLYSLLAFREVHLGEQDLATLRARRKEVVPALVRRLAAINLSKPMPQTGEVKLKTPDPKKPDEGEIVTDSGINPRALNGLLFEMLISLDAVEALPELLRLEDQIRDLLAASDSNPKLAPPPVQLDGFVRFPDGARKLSKRDELMAKGRVMQRELLSVMLQLLRRQKFAPLLASDIEKTYGDLLKARAQQEDLREFKSLADAKAKGEDWVRFDPIYHVPIGYLHPQPTLPFTPELRSQARGFAKQFIDTVPRDRWLVTDDPQ